MLHGLLFLIVMLDEEIPCDLWRVLTSCIAITLIAAFEEEDGVVRSCEIGCEWTTAWSGTNYNVVVLVCC